ncbi:GtrA family protein [Bradyrhizobium genosp. P]|uniref:GtrA family protein n=1 Tax=Bradyrhizobium genosp. P TaxID=83641 RepID=UPI003CF1090C
MANDNQTHGATGHEDERTTVTFVKFVLVGVANTAFGYALFALFYLLLGSHLLAITLATACGVVFNFHSTGRLVFRSRRLSALLPFVAGHAAIWLVNILLLDELTALRIPPLAGQLLAIPILALISYAINRYLVFGSPRRRRFRS